MKKLLLLSVALISLLLFGCGGKEPTKILHCDRCGRELEYPADSNITDDAIIVCRDCQKDLYP